MAKKKQPAASTTGDASTNTTTTPAVTADVRECRLTVPLGPVGSGYVSQHVDAQLSLEQAQTLKQIYNALELRNARLQGGKRINSQADALRWLLEQITAPPADVPDVLGFPEVHQ